MRRSYTLSISACVCVCRCTCASMRAKARLQPWVYSSEALLTLLLRQVLSLTWSLPVRLARTAREP